MFREFSIVAIVAESSTIKSFYLKRKDNEPLETFLPGQFITVKVKPANNGKEQTRNYTLSDSPQRNYYRITIKREVHGIVSKYLHDEVTEGDIIEISRPAGSFHLIPGSDKPAVFLSGGVGITPMLSMLEFLSENEPSKKVFFLHSSLNKAVQPMFSRLKELESKNRNMYLSIHHADPGPEEIPGTDYHYKGMISKDYLLHTLPKTEADYFLCGPTGFMEAMYQHLVALGVNENSIHYEFFGEGKRLGHGEFIQKPTSKSFKVKFTKSDVEGNWDDTNQSILEFAEANGLNPAFSCRMGTCSTCESSLLKGNIQYEPEPFMEATEGKIFICCSRPVSDVEIDL